MPTTPLRHKLAFHCLTASIVFNFVQFMQLHNIETGRMIVQPSSQHVSLIESIFP